MFTNESDQNAERSKNCHNENLVKTIKSRCILAIDSYSIFNQASLIRDKMENKSFTP